MITLWISTSLLAITGWQGYRLGKEYGWWKPGSSPSKSIDDAGVDVQPDSDTAGLGKSRTDFDKLLTGYRSGQGQDAGQADESDTLTQSNESPVTEPATTLLQMNADEYPSETDQVPDGCDWMDDEAILLVDTVGEGIAAEPIVQLTDYVRRVRTVQRKMTQLTRRRAADNSFMKQELGILIDTYQLSNDQSLDWLFEDHKQPGQPDYGALFDRIEGLCA